MQKPRKMRLLFCLPMPCKDGGMSSEPKNEPSAETTLSHLLLDGHQFLAPEKVGRLVETLSIGDPTAYEGMSPAAAILYELQLANHTNNPVEKIRALHRMLELAGDGSRRWTRVRDAALDLSLPYLAGTSDREVGRLANLTGQAIGRRRTNQ